MDFSPADQSYIEEAPIGVFVLDGAGTCVDVNPAGCEMLGYDRSELRSKSISDLSQGGPDAGPMDAFRELRETGRVQTEIQLAHSDGHTVHVSLSAVTVSEDRFLGYCQDISERVSYQQRLEESEARYRSMTRALDTSNVGTFILDSDFTVAWINEAIEAFFGLDRETLIGADKAETIASEIKYIFEEPEQFADTVLASYEDNSYVESFTCRITEGEDREARWLLHWSTPIEQGLYDGGRIEHYTDITETMAYEQRLEEQRDNMRVLNEVMRHDIRNDLQLILANADFLGDSVDDEATAHLETIRSSAEEAVELTRTARETADMMLTPEDGYTAVGLRSTLERELDDVRATNPVAVVTVETTIPAVQVRADDLLGSVFRNLLTNAIRHNDADVPAVRVSVLDRPGTVVVRVRDNGPGVADERKDEIFGKNERGLDSRGSGLGLYLVRTLVESYGGETWVEDRADDESGSVFVVELPKAE